MKKIPNRTRKIITYASFLLLTLLFTKICAYVPLSHNPQGEYCETHATEFNMKNIREDFFNSFLDRRIFVEIDDKFFPYNPALHNSYKLIYVEHEDHDINLSNYKTFDGNPCTLTKDFYEFCITAFIIFFSFLRFIVYPLIKPKKPTTTGE